ncbi:hypothetical protein HID58_021195 [Brassica napus]|uniref:Uncharacterized protein n=1 Tax=Brassica napus TaxID=3708 RepID=A0ABQ8CVQ5_BRANA|nr:hypothetical protein HID58_021195 [Brassica napus]
MFTEPRYYVTITYIIHHKRPRGRLAPNFLKRISRFLKLPHLETLIDHYTNRLRIHRENIRRSVIIQHLIKQIPSFTLFTILEKNFQKHIPSMWIHSKLLLQQRPVTHHSFLILTFLKPILHKSSIHNPIVNSTLTFQLIKELIRLI